MKLYTAQGTIEFVEEGDWIYVYKIVNGQKILISKINKSQLQFMNNEEDTNKR